MSELLEYGDTRVFHAGTLPGEHHCRDCANSMGYASPNPKYWSCNVVRDDKLVQFRFVTRKDDPNTVRMTSENCHEFKKREGTGW